MSLFSFFCHKIKHIFIVFAFQIVMMVHWLVTVSVMMRPTMLSAIMILGTAVDLMSIRIFVQIALVRVRPFQSFFCAEFIGLPND